jgi:hypothetical protein
MKANKAEYKQMKLHCAQPVKPKSLPAHLSYNSPELERRSIAHWKRELVKPGLHEEHIQCINILLQHYSGTKGIRMISISI